MILSTNQQDDNNLDNLLRFLPLLANQKETAQTHKNL